MAQPQRQQQDVVVTEGTALAIGGGHGDVLRELASFLVVDQLPLFAPQAPLDDGAEALEECGLEHIDLVRRHGALDHILSQAERGIDQDAIGESALRVDGEHDA